jgi:hypothetical protein
MLATRWTVVWLSMLLLAMVPLAVVAGCSDEAAIPEAVLNSPPARRVEPPPEYYPEQPRDKVASDGRPLFELTVDRPYQAWTLPQTAANSLASLGPVAVPVLVPQLRAADLAQRRQAAEILARVGHDAARTGNLGDVAAIVERVEDPSEDLLVRKGCARAMGHIGPALAAARLPSAPAARQTLDSLPPLTSEQLADPTIVAARQREVARPQFQIDRAEREAQRYSARLQDYRQRQQLAQRAAAALLRIAEQGAGETLAASE